MEKTKAPNRKTNGFSSAPSNAAADVGLSNGSSNNIVNNHPHGVDTTMNGTTNGEAFPVPGEQTHQRPSTAAEDQTVAICCGCRPQRRRYHKETTFSNSVRRVLMGSSRGKFYDANIGPDNEWRGSGPNIDDNENDDSLFYFDAVDRPLGDEEYPVATGSDGTGRYIVRNPILGNYPIVFTTAIPHPAPQVSLAQPETMLRHMSDDTLLEDEEANEGVEVWSSEPINSHKEPSMRLLRIRRRPTMEHSVHLATPRVKIREKGYPGELTREEVDECEKFLRGLKQMENSSAVSEQVYSFRDIEEEPYTICRWLRATKFDAAKILQRLSDNQELFDQAKVNEFYPDVDAAIGAPVSVFLSQYPFLAVGRGKNGCPVNYFHAGKINPEGILCLTTVERLRCYFWNTFMWKFKREIRQSQAADPDFVRIEGINVVDLNGLSSSALTSETMEVIKLASKISDFFPETLHCMIILNAPGFFALSWGLIKKFIDPRTAARIQLFANAEKGQRALENLVDKTQLPTDYGGSNISLKSAFLREAADDSILRQEIELLHCKKKGKAQSKVWVLAANETIEIAIYTRSVSMAAIFVKVNDSTFQTVEAGCLWSDGAVPALESTNVLPNKILAVVSERIIGPGKVIVEATDLDTAEKKHSNSSRGYFLIVGDVKSTQQQPPSNTNTATISVPISGDTPTNGSLATTTTTLSSSHTTTKGSGRRGRKKTREKGRLR